jgi:hypothetical protein
MYDLPEIIKLFTNPSCHCQFLQLPHRIFIMKNFSVNRIISAALLIIICSCTRLHTRKYPLINEKEIGFGMDKDSINNLTEIHYVDLRDKNQSYYYLKDQILFDSLILEFYSDKLYGIIGIDHSENLSPHLFKFLSDNFNLKKNNTKYFSVKKKNYCLELTFDEKERFYRVSFFERNIYDGLIFHCGFRRRIHFWKSLRSDYRRHLRKRQKVLELLNL